MHLPRYALALAASALMAGAAAAQPTSSTDPAAPDTSVQTPADTTTADHMPMTAPAASTTAADVAATTGQPVVHTQLVTMQPIPDTPENRAKYGQPLSRAGKRTAPAGN
jgi:hypothetical protein